VKCGDQSGDDILHEVCDVLSLNRVEDLILRG
jgi:hypothetical protein